MSARATPVERRPLTRTRRLFAYPGLRHSSRADLLSRAHDHRHRDSDTRLRAVMPACRKGTAFAPRSVRSRGSSRPSRKCSTPYDNRHPVRTGRTSSDCPRQAPSCTAGNEYAVAVALICVSVVEWGGYPCQHARSKLNSGLHQPHSATKNGLPGAPKFDLQIRSIVRLSDHRR